MNIQFYLELKLSMNIMQPLANHYHMKVFVNHERSQILTVFAFFSVIFGIFSHPPPTPPKGVPQNLLAPTNCTHATSPGGGHSTFWPRMIAMLLADILLTSCFSASLARNFIKYLKSQSTAYHYMFLS